MIPESSERWSLFWSFASFIRFGIELLFFSGNCREHICLNAYICMPFFLDYLVSCLWNFLCSVRLFTAAAFAVSACREQLIYYQLLCPLSTTFWPVFQKFFNSFKRKFMHSQQKFLLFRSVFINAHTESIITVQINENISKFFY